MTDARRKPTPARHSPPRQHQPRVRVGLSVPLLVGTFVTAALLLPGLYFWRARQVEQGAAAYVERAEALAKAGEWNQSAEYLFLYLRMRPEDADARIRLAETFEHTASRRPQLERAVELYYQAIAAAPADRQDRLRVRLGELLLQAQNYASAEIEARTLLKDTPRNPAALRILGLALFGQAETGGLTAGNAAQSALGEVLEEAVELNPADVQLAFALARVYREKPQLLAAAGKQLSAAERAQRADACLDRLVSTNPENASVYLARYQYRLSNALPGANDDLERALQVAPENLLVVLSAAEMRARKALDSLANAEQRNELLTAAAQLYERAIHLAPANERCYLGLGEVQALQNDPDQAVSTWELGLEKCGQDCIGLNARLAEMLIFQGHLSKAEQRIARLDASAAAQRRQGASESQLNFARWAELLKAQVLLAKQKPDEAIDLLRRVANGQKVKNLDGVLTYRALMILGNLYASQQQSELAIKAFDDASVARADSNEPLVAAAKASLASNQPERATAYLRKAIAVQPSAEAQNLLAAAKLAEQLKLPPAERDWSSVEALLQEAGQARTPENATDTWVLSLLEAEYLQRKHADGGNGRSGVESALVALRNSESAAASSREGLIAIAQAFERLGSPADADRVVQALQHTFADEPNSYLLAASILSARKSYDQAREVIARGLRSVKPENQLGLQLAVVGLAMVEGTPDLAWQELNRLHQQQPSNLVLLRRLSEFALEQRKFEEAAKLEQELSALSTTQPNDWKLLKFRRLLLQANGSQDPSLDDAQAILVQLRQEHPNTAGCELLAGQLAEQRGNLEQAAEAYQAAIRLGLQETIVYERLIMVLYQLGRLREVDEYLAKLHDRSPESAGAYALEISVALKSGKLERALAAARAAVAQRPNDPSAHVWLGQLLLADEQIQQAEEPLRKAVALSPSDSRACGALLNYLVRVKRVDAAREVLEDFGRNLQGSPAERALVMANGYDLIGDHTKSLASFEEAAQLEPQNAVIQERMAASLMSRDPVASEKAFRRALELNPASTSSRRMLAGLLADRGGRQRWNEALKLLESEPANGATAEVDERLQALVYAARGGSDNLKQAQQILERITATPHASPSDRLFLAQVCDARGDAAGARQQYLKLIDQPNPSADHLAAYVEWLLSRNEPQEVGRWLDRLDQLQPETLRAVSLRVRWLHSQKRDVEIEPLIEATAKRMLEAESATASVSAGQEQRAALAAGDLYYSVRNWPAAERWYRQANKFDQQALGRLAICLGEQDRLGEALDLYVASAASDDSVRFATEIATILVRVPSTSQDAQKAEPILTRALDQHGDDAKFLMALATLRLVQGNSDEACNLYRKVTELDSRSVDAWNNLALALAEQPSRAAEGIECIDKAIELAGPRPNLLDTKAAVLLAVGKFPEAVALLADATSATNADPRFYLHLAAGHLGTGELNKAREALAIANKRDLKNYVLSDTDNKLLAQLEAQLH